MDIKNQLNMAGQGAKLVAKQAERMKIANVSLPAAYRKLGEEIFKAGLLRNEFQELYSKLSSSIKDQGDLNQAKPAAEGFAEKMKAAAISAKNMAVSKKMEYDRAGMFLNLGQLGFENHFDILNNCSSVAIIKTEIEKLQKLDEEISILNAVGKNSFFNPRFFAIGMVSLLFLSVAVGISYLIFNGPKKSDQYIALEVLNKTNIPIKDNPILTRGPNGEELFDYEFEMQDKNTGIFKSFKTKDEKERYHGNFLVYKDKDKKQLRRTGAFFDGKRHGNWTEIFNDQISTTYQFEKRKPIGITKGFDKNGKEEWSITFNENGETDTSKMNIKGFVHQMRLIQGAFEFGTVNDDWWAIQAWSEIGPIFSDEPSAKDKIQFLVGGNSATKIDPKGFQMYLGKPFQIKVTNIDKQYPNIIRTCQYKLTDGFAYVNVANESILHEQRADFLSVGNSLLVYSRCFHSPKDYYSNKK